MKKLLACLGQGGYPLTGYLLPVLQTVQLLPVLKKAKIGTGLVLQITTYLAHSELVTIAVFLGVL